MPRWHYIFVTRIIFVVNGKVLRTRALYPLTTEGVPVTKFLSAKYDVLVTFFESDTAKNRSARQMIKIKFSFNDYVLVNVFIQKKAVLFTKL